MMTRRQAALALSAAFTSWAAENKPESGERVRLLRAPEGGLQPQVATDDRGALHLVYYRGDAHHGNLFYVRSTDHGATFSPAIPVNQPGSAGTIRGAQLAIGQAGRVHVAWKGSNEAKLQVPVNPDSGKPGAPMFYTRLDDTGKAFEPERNLID
jgi:hypothetical protein